VALRIAEHASITDVGRQRHTNEDSYYENPPVFAVADGMGGAQAGEVASAIAVEQFDEMGDDDASPEQRLEKIAQSGNRKIFEMAQSDSRQAGMGTTLISAIVGDHEVAVGHVGDSRLYLLRDGTLQQLTNDHSLVEEFVRQGRLTREQAEKHPQRSVITRALGPEEDVEVDTFSVPARHGDVFLLCSDGLSTMLNDETIQRILENGSSVENAAKTLVDAANQNGGRDNITVVLFRLEDDGGPDTRRSDTQDYDTIAGTEAAPTTEQIEAERRRVAGLETQAAAPAAPSSQLAVGSWQEASRASPSTTVPAASPPTASSPTANPPTANPATSRPRQKTRRGRWFLRTIAAAVLVLAIAGGGIYLFARSVWFLGTNDEGVVTLYRGLPYDLPLGVHLYSPDYVSGVPALALPAQRRERVLDHQLRSHSDAIDLIRSLDVTESR
jgi:PPM family protein phosphatase